MNLTGTPEDIIDAIERDYPDIRAVLEQARGIVPPSTRAVYEYQAAALYALARPYNRRGMRTLEIGTAQGYSAAVMALACPDAHITTLNPHGAEATTARRNLAGFGERIEVVEQKSWDYLAAYSGKPFDFIFIDGDHKNVRMDLPWWAYLTIGGTMVFHDYSPNGTPRACPPVYRALLEFKARLGRDFDALIVDDTGVGMAGFARRAGEDFEADDREKLAAAHSYSSASYSYITGLYRLAKTLNGVKGAVVEYGCQNGGSAAALALGAGVKRDVVLFDTFTGVPEPGFEDDGIKAHERWASNQPGGWAVGDRIQVETILQAVGNEKPILWSGDFTQSAYPVKHVHIAILHIDATLYRSTRAALQQAYGKVEAGGLIILSAYHHWEGIRKAVYDFFGGNVPALNTLEKGAWFRK